MCVCVCVCAARLRWHLIPSPSSLDWQVNRAMNSPDQLQRSSLENLTRPSLSPQALKRLHTDTTSITDSLSLYTTHTHTHRSYLLSASISLIKSLIREIPQYITTWALVPVLHSWGPALCKCVCVCVCILIFSPAAHTARGVLEWLDRITNRHTHHTSITDRQEDTRSEDRECIVCLI